MAKLNDIYSVESPGILKRKTSVFTDRFAPPPSLILSGPKGKEFLNLIENMQIFQEGGNSNETQLDDCGVVVGWQILEWSDSIMCINMVKTSPKETKLIKQVVWAPIYTYNQSVINYSWISGTYYVYMDAPGIPDVPISLAMCCLRVASIGFLPLVVAPNIH